MNIDIGSKIKTLRLSKSMTQEQLAKALHVSAQAVSKWENGSSLPDIQLLPALSVTLGTSIDSLFSLTDESRFARIDNMLWDKRFLTQQEFDDVYSMDYMNAWHPSYDALGGVPAFAEIKFSLTSRA